jgi:hypothetical protein
MPSNGNGTWKWIAGLLGTVVTTVGLLMYSGTQARIAEGDAAIMEAIKDMRMSNNIQDSQIARLNSQDAVKTQWERMVSKKVDLLLKHAGIPEYMWPSIDPDTTQ